MDALQTDSRTDESLETALSDPLTQQIVGMMLEAACTPLEIRAWLNFQRRARVN
jgi:hypothetical protein